MSEITLVVQYEGDEQIAHLAVMAPGAIRGHGYPEHERHEQVARYLCTEDTPTYTGWDQLTVNIIQNHDGPLCPKCFAGMSTS